MRPLFCINEEHAARLEAAFVQDAIRRHVKHADLGSHDDQVVFRHVVAGRAQAVAVQDRANFQPVGESDGSGSVPRFHEAAMVIVERLFLVAHAFMIQPRLGDHHHDGMRQRATRQHEQFKAVVEHGRIAAIGVDHRQQFLDIVAEDSDSNMAWRACIQLMFPGGC